MNYYMHFSTYFEDLAWKNKTLKYAAYQRWHLQYTFQSELFRQLEFLAREWCHVQVHWEKTHLTILKLSRNFGNVKYVTCVLASFAKTKSRYIFPWMCKKIYNAVGWWSFRGNCGIYLLAITCKSENTPLRSMKIV